jgi:hypothetical protein
MRQTGRFFEKRRYCLQVATVFPSLIIAGADCGLGSVSKVRHAREK